MKKTHRITALFLCILMMFPAQAMTINADTEENPAVVSTEEITKEETETIERIEETLEVEEIKPAEERIEETLPVEPLTVWNEEAIIYWNPGGELPAELASASNATKASASNAKKGRDSADGMSPERPVKTLSRALEQAEKLKGELGVETSEITIYAMSPMEIADGQLYVLNGANIRIASWPGRSYDNDTIFYVNGGQLSLINTLLVSGNQEDDPEETQLITVHGGTLQFGQAVEINGQIAMDYRKVKEIGLWETASASNTATSSNAAAKNSESGGITSFNIDDYILSTDEDSAELVEDTTIASTWCKPVIELMEGYEDSIGEYLLDVNTDTSSNQIELVRTLYADELTGEEFLDYFTITYNDDTGAQWNLTAATNEAAAIRDTASEDTALYRSFARKLTTTMYDDIAPVTVASTKLLIATRAGSSTVKYWNPGGALTVSGRTYRAGSDTGVDGNDPDAAYKTWDKAVANANGGTIICMQSVTLGSGADEYIGNPQLDGSYLIQSSSRETMVTLMAWKTQPQPVFIVPSGETLVLKNIELIGIEKDGVAASTQMVLCQSGDIVIEENVTAETGYIQVNAFTGLADHPVTVNSIDAADDGIITLFFGGINDNLSYRFADVVVPGAALSAEVAADADAVGKKLLSRIVLDTANRDTAHGGQSNFDWSLRQDTDEDDPLSVNPQNLELYTEYYYDAIYLDGERGNNNYYGATCQYPVKTWGRAYEIWSAQMRRSIEAREAAYDNGNGMTSAEIDEKFPVPTVIYICGTVTVDTPEHWKLETWTDYNGTNLTTEVRSHVDIPHGDDGTTLIHELPKILAEVNSGGDLSVENITIRNYTGEKDSVTLQVNSGGKLMVTGDTLLTGERLESVETLTPYQEVTEGTHVQVTAGGTFVLNDGIIERREHGVEGIGIGAQIKMEGGEIRKNNSYDEALFRAKDTDQIKGAGVILSNGSGFVMNGGKITQNTVYQYGAGVYLSGNGTSFTMNKGEVSGNQMAGYLSYYEAGSSETSDVHGYGIGIYAGKGTVVNLGRSMSTAADTLVTKNMGYWADGIGVWTDGTLNVENATISENYNSTGGYTYNVRKGLGLYAGGNAKVTMDGAAITGNYSAKIGYYGSAQGVGIYLEYNMNGNVIKNSSITGNIVGFERGSSETYSAGGGIYLAGGVLDIESSVIQNNEALYGAGIMAYSTDTNDPIKLTVSSTEIRENTARLYNSTSYYGNGGGIYAQGYGTIDLGTGTKVNQNESKAYGGGMYIYGYDDTYRLNLTMTGTEVNQNKSYSFGAGIYAYFHTTMVANTVELKENISTNGSGGGISAYGTGSSYTNKLYFTDVNIEANEAVNGAGIYGYYYTYMYFNNVKIKNNTASNTAGTSGTGGGIYSQYYSYMYFNEVDIENNTAFMAGGIYGYRYIYMYFNDTNIKNNTATTGAGGGIYCSYTYCYLYFYKTNIEGNTAATSGGGIYLSSTNYASVRFLDVTIKGNTATSGSGGGCYLNYGTHYLTDTKISNNTAGDNGGGLYLGNGTLYFTENSAGGSTITENTAASGGGIYSLLTVVYLDIDGEYQNMATNQGSNLYLGIGSNRIYTGMFKQPSTQNSGVYNIYLNVTSSATHALYMDPQSVEIEKKAGSEPDAVYLNTTNSFLSYTAEPPNNHDGELPIDVNTEVFKAGSIVVKPATLASHNLSRVTITSSGNYAGYATSTATYTKPSASLPDATTNIAYNSGGSLPRRTQLGGYNNNIVIVGEGVYLSTTTGDDIRNQGTSPDDAVATFDKAKEILEQRIIETEASDALETDPSKQIGFSPFIYICGNVLISRNETWKLDYEDSLYTSNNVNYIKSEQSPYDAQVRRFASFVNAPMITVGSSATDTVEFTTEKIIINGMADAVVYNDQLALSPVLKVMNQSTATLTGNSRITNNYSNGVDLYGSLVLTGSKNDENKQLLNHHGSYVRIMASNASLVMDGYARIAAEESAAQIGSEYLYAVYQTSSSYTNTKVVMKDSSSIGRLTTGSSSRSLLNYGIYLTGQYSEILMQDSSKIDNLSYYAAYATGANSAITMRGSANISNISNSNSYTVNAIGAGSKVTMQDSANIQNCGYGVYISGASALCMIQDSASIQVTYRGVLAAGATSAVEMKNSSQIITTSYITNSYATPSYFGVYLSGANSKLSMIDSAQIIGNGIFIGNYGIQIEMSEDALLIGDSTQAGVGIFTYSATSTADQSTIVMKDNARIANHSYGIFFTIFNSPIHITMSGKAAIEQNNYAIFEYLRGSSYTGYGVDRFSLEMGDNTRISGNYYNGIRLLGYKAFTAASYHSITLKDNAIIGGTAFWDGSDAASGNRYSGIYANSPINLEMSDNSKISGNGYVTSASSYSSTNAISLVTFYSNSSQSDLRATETARITLKGYASICDNKGGIYVQYAGSSYPLNPCEITLDGKNGSPSIQGNTDAVYLMGTDQKIKLQETAILDESSTSINGENLALDCYGSVELDGRSQINGLTYLRTTTLPITMTHAVKDPSREYRLWLVEGFLGQIVVQPDGLSGGLTDVTDQLGYFTKAGAVGMAEDKALVAAAPNIILTGENNVYLSGTGADTNDGNSPSTSVRTFKRAKALLEGAGYYTSGANIIICNSVVEVAAGDEDWSFDSNGKVTNSLSGDNWEPVVIRYESYTSGRLIQLTAGTSTDYADTVTFKNITIDGGSTEGITATSSVSELLYVGYGRTVILGEGAVLQNNTINAVASASSVGVLVYGGTLEIEGGIIQNMVRSSTTTTTTSYYMSSAIYCYSYSAFYPGTVKMKSGQIINNTVSMSSKLGNLRAGAISVEGQYTVFEMSGGLIADNKVAVMSGQSKLRPTYGAGLVSYNAKSNISGGIIRGNEGVLGSAVYYYDTNGVGSMILSGGQITGNTTNESGQKPEGIYSPIFVAGWDFQLSGGGTDIQDNIYLNSTENIIKVSGNIYQTGRLYHLFLNQAASSSDTTKFQKGSTVVQPDGSWITDVTPYLSYFRVHSNPYVLDAGKSSRTTGTVSGIKENQCLILMHAVFLDSEKGSDSNNGTNPDKAVETFAGAQAVGQAGIGSSDVSDYYVIYISGKATNKTAAENIWTLPEPAYMCRYTGFPIFNSDGSDASVFHEYHGYLIEPSYDLTFDGVTVYGRRSIDTVKNNGESLVNVKDGITITVKKDGDAGTIFGRNYNQFEYDDGVENLSTRGGAFHVEAGGNLYLLGGIIFDTNASYGSAVYLEADKADTAKFAHLYLSGSPSIAGAVYLSGTGSTTAAYIEPDASYIPATALNIVIGNDYDGRCVVKYSDGTIPGYKEKDYYNLEDSIKALYDVVTDNSVLKLKIRNYLYLDGQSGKDDTGDGKTPETAFKTIARVYKEIEAGGAVEGTLVFVVDTVEFTSSTPAIALGNILIRNPDGTSSYEGSYEDDNGISIGISGQVYFKRYAQPTGYNGSDTDYTGYDKTTLMDTLFLVKFGGKLTLNGIYLDGHSQDSNGADKLLVAAGVEAKSPLVTVMNGGILTCELKNKGSITNGVDTTTVFTNNINVNQKSNTIGNIDGTDIIEGSSAGIELLGGDGGDPANPVVGSTNGGQAFLTRTEFRNLSLGSNVVSGGTDIYSFGDLHFSNLTFFSGTVFLEGFGTAATKSNYETSHYLTVDLYGQPAQEDFQVLMRDPYNGRTVVYYAPEGTDGPDSTQSGRFRLEERVKEFFYLTKREGVPYVFELQVPAAVYIDGINGVDDTDDRTAGSNPRNPVKTLERAFDLLYTRSGHTIYVVGSIQIKPDMGDIIVTGTTYTGIRGTIALGSTDKVKITRYVQPDFALNDPNEAAATGYDVTDYQGELLNVQDAATASFGTNVYFDGHSEPKLGEEYPLEGRVSNGAKAKAPLITVEEGGTLNLYTGTILLDNNNTYDEAAGETGQNGGVLYNSGTTIIDGALFENNQATWGSGVYQDGTFTIKSAPENLAEHSFYLTTENTGTKSAPVWGTDHIIQTYAAIPDGLTFDIEMDHAVKGRDVVKFLDSSAYDPDVDAEHDHFKPGSTVPEYLFLVEAPNDETVLELQNWEVLDVNVPSDIYLVIHRSGSLDTTTKLGSVRTEADGTDLLTSPEYTITNRGRYDVKVSVTAFENQNTAAGITANGHEKMTLVDEAVNVLGEKDLYLAIKGLDSGSTGLTIPETSLEPYDKAPVREDPAVLGIIPTNVSRDSSGSFKFVGAVGTGFVDKYKDMSFPISGVNVTRADLQAHMDGTSGTVNARAKYAMKFKLEIDPPRPGDTGSSTANP